LQRAGQKLVAGVRKACGGRQKRFLAFPIAPLAILAVFALLLQRYKKSSTNASLLLVFSILILLY
jgi:hypothetical protein